MASFCGCGDFQKFSMVSTLLLASLFSGTISSPWQSKYSGNPIISECAVIALEQFTLAALAFILLFVARPRYRKVLFCSGCILSSICSVLVCILGQVLSIPNYSSHWAPIIGLGFSILCRCGLVFIWCSVVPATISLFPTKIGTISSLSVLFIFAGNTLSPHIHSHTHTDSYDYFYSLTLSTFLLLALCGAVFIPKYQKVKVAPYKDTFGTQSGIQIFTHSGVFNVNAMAVMLVASHFGHQVLLKAYLDQAGHLSSASTVIYSLLKIVSATISLFVIDRGYETLVLCSGCALVTLGSVFWGLGTYLSFLQVDRHPNAFKSTSLVEGQPSKNMICGVCTPVEKLFCVLFFVKTSLNSFLQLTKLKEPK